MCWLTYTHRRAELHKCTHTQHTHIHKHTQTGELSLKNACMSTHTHTQAHPHRCTQKHTTVTDRLMYAPHLKKCPHSPAGRPQNLPSAVRYARTVPSVCPGRLGQPSHCSVLGCVCCSMLQWCVCVCVMQANAWMYVCLKRRQAPLQHTLTHTHTATTHTHHPSLTC